jgi:hypothetical protein
MLFGMLRPRSFALFVCVVWSPSFCQAQQTVVPAVTFTCDFPGSDPSHYVISVSSDGRASYVSDGKLSAQSESDSGEPVRLDFTISQTTTARIFDLTKRAHYFEGGIDSGKKKLASTGRKTLTYNDAQKNTQATYNYSPIPAVQELTATFQNLSATLEFGRRIEYDYRYQKLALDQELKRMDEMSSAGSLEDLPAVAPTLQKIAMDASILNVVRARAERLLARAGQRTQ